MQNRLQNPAGERALRFLTGKNEITTLSSDFTGTERAA
jgi:hypothetical protein